MAEIQLELIRRYQACAQRICDLFPKDPTEPQPGLIERLEQILDEGRLTPTAPSTPAEKPSNVDINHVLGAEREESGKI